MRSTRQRKVIINYLRSLKTHPTADELFPGLKKKLPTLSLGSLYRNLDLLAKEKMITRMDGFGDSKRYDGDTREHFHFLCLECGAVSDYENEKTCEIRRIAQNILSLDPNLNSVKIELSGICDNCKGKQINITKKTTKERL